MLRMIKIATNFKTRMNAPKTTLYDVSHRSQGATETFCCPVGSAYGAVRASNSLSLGSAGGDSF